jgi:hypothetical protein
VNFSGPSARVPFCWAASNGDCSTKRAGSTYTSQTCSCCGYVDKGRSSERREASVNLSQRKPSRLSELRR